MTSNDVILWSHDHPKTAIYFNCCIFSVIIIIILLIIVVLLLTLLHIHTCTCMPQGGSNVLLIYIKHLFPQPLYAL